jgi:signal transduction histidine kinase
MKRKLKIVLALIVLSLTGIIVFQCHWSIGAYQVNKKRFDAQIDVAMQMALDSCKKDYFDSIRMVLVKRLSEATTVIKIDSPSQINTVATGHASSFSNGTFNTPYVIWISVHGSKRSRGFETDKNRFDYYRTKIAHKATIPEVIAEMSFYEPLLMTCNLDDFGIYDGMYEATAYMSAHHANKLPDGWVPEHTGIYQLPPNYKQADGLKLSNYLRDILGKKHINVGFNIQLTDKPSQAKPGNLLYSETNEYRYQYHGFIFLLNHYTKQPFYTFYVKAVVHNPQYAVIKGMLITLGFSALLVLFTIFSFYYIMYIINQQKALGELKDDFINNMTHELKTPIATIAVAIEGMQKYNVLNDPEKTQRYLETSRNELARLNELVSKVLDVAAFENKEVKLIKEKINIDELVNELITAERSKADKTTTITYKNEAGIIDITADKLHFKNVLMNILDNAVKYSTEPAVISITLTKSNNMAVFTIQDNGIGIPAAHLNRIFKKFYRVPTGNIHNVKGTGLGLNYVKYIAEAHGGSVTVKSEVNAGSEFIVSIPL